ncbi:metallophosphoesterase [Ornithinicoccus hortensis]|uniref:Putative MPP superfamily phosphohydrolase n=1 Tax=Ornithinicoccus hortensis TaxID=82346 RepID=A0A542YW40_9MICO|nr:metallophosphoesterase [Ornithinicoccus hortensis]TQL52300.1 putative MPP superfamily phosphohydrolase [Ornithinicoccus hortensis]
MHPVWRVGGSLVGAGLGVLGWSTLVEPRAFALRRFDVPVLPAGSRPLRVLHLSDLHLLPSQRYRIDWVRGLAALAPDLVVTTGDNLAGPDAVPAVLDAYRDLLGIPGVFVLGSNDYFPPTYKNPLRYFNDSHARGEHLTPHRLPTQDLVDGFTAAGWVDLDNARTRLTVGGLDLEFVGVDDPHLEYDDYASIAGPADPAADLMIGVTHAPYQRILDPMAADGARLLLAGHTHGGQVCVPGHGALVTNCDLDTSRAKGLSRWWPGAARAKPRAMPPEGAAYLHVSAGLGAAPTSPFRLACRPEASLLTLREARR